MSPPSPEYGLYRQNHGFACPSTSIHWIVSMDFAQQIAFAVCVFWNIIVLEVICNSNMTLIKASSSIQQARTLGRSECQMSVLEP